MHFGSRWHKLPMDREKLAQHATTRKTPNETTTKALWIRTATIRDASNGPLACSFACSLALLTHLLASHCSLCLCAPLRLFICLLAHTLLSSWESELSDVSSLDCFLGIKPRCRVPGRPPLLRECHTGSHTAQTEAHSCQHLYADIAFFPWGTLHYGPEQPGIQIKVLDHSLVGLLIRSHCSLIPLLHRAHFTRFTCALCCTH